MGLLEAIERLPRLAPRPALPSLRRQPAATAGNVISLPRAPTSEPIDPRRATPQQMASLSMDLYLSGRLDFEECAMLGFQAELHPRYAATLGALTNEPARPDAWRDYIALWEDRLKFALRHGGPDCPRTGCIRRIVRVLRTVSDRGQAGRACA